MSPWLVTCKVFGEFLTSLLRLGLEHPSFRMRSERSAPLRHRRGFTIFHVHVPWDNISFTFTSLLLTVPKAFLIIVRYRRCCCSCWGCRKVFTFSRTIGSILSKVCTKHFDERRIQVFFLNECTRLFPRGVNGKILKIFRMHIVLSPEPLGRKHLWVIHVCSSRSLCFF